MKTFEEIVNIWNKELQIDLNSEKAIDYNGAYISGFLTGNFLIGINFDCLKKQPFNFEFNKIISLLHEIGHYIDSKKPGYSRYDEVKIEIDAWYEAAKLFHEYGFTNWDEFFKISNHCLNSYIQWYNRSDRILIEFNSNISNKYKKAA